MGIASAELDVSADVNTNSMNVFDTPSRKREEFRLHVCLSPSPTKCNRGEQLMRVESKLDMVLQILQAKPENTSQEVHVPLPQITTPPMLPAMLPPPQLPGPSHQHAPAPQSSIVSPQFSTDPDSFLDDICSLLSEDQSCSIQCSLQPCVIQ